MAARPVNLRALEDMAPKFGLSEGLEARFARENLGVAGLGLSLQRLAPGFRLPFAHRHHEQDEVYVVVAGSGRAKIDDEIVALRTWDVVSVPAAAMRAFEAGPDGMEYIAFGAGHPARARTDAEIVPGWWSD